MQFPSHNQDETFSEHLNVFVTVEGRSAWGEARLSETAEPILTIEP